jgi:hypothetical protein
VPEDGVEMPGEGTLSAVCAAARLGGVAILGPPDEMQGVRYVTTVYPFCLPFFVYGLRLIDRAFWQEDVRSFAPLLASGRALTFIRCVRVVPLVSSLDSYVYVCEIRRHCGRCVM